MFTTGQRVFLEAQRVGRLATADAAGQPQVVPVCFAYDETRILIPLDTKPKRVPPARLRRVRNILANPRVALVFDRYDDDDWSRLAYLLIEGTASLLPPEDPAHRRGVLLLRHRYTQYQAMPIDTLPMIAIAPDKVIGWGRFS
jgi:PPOX class probable F420-dependent enzyme